MAFFYLGSTCKISPTDDYRLQLKKNDHFEEFHLRNIDKWKSAGKSNVCFKVFEVFNVTVKFKTLVLPDATSCKEQTANSLVFFV